MRLPILRILILLLLLGWPAYLALADNGPHGGYTATTDACAVCHRAHTSQGSRLINSAISGNNFCYSCHDGTGAPLPPVVSTHSNNAFASRQEAVFQLECVQCHEPHGHPTNLISVRDDVKVTTSPLVTTGPVVFTSRTGANSFDESDASDADDLCATCHSNASNPGFPMNSHVGGDHGAAGGSDERGNDCATCHTHDLDGDLLTDDGFMPRGCTDCHNTTQGIRRQVVDSNGDGTGTGGDFLRSSHHVNGAAPIDADCVVCHDTGTHQGGTVRLLNVDTELAIPYTTGIDLEPFCLACHDSNGAAGSSPFSDAVMPPVIDGITWAAASHDTSIAGYSGTCYECHDNGHGSNKTNLLAPWNDPGTGPADDPWQQEEHLCYGCHSAAGVATSDVAGTFAPATNWINDPPTATTTKVGTNRLVTLNDRHDIALSDQTISGSAVECVNCHDPHAANSASPLIADPDPADGRVPGTGYVPGGDYMTDWCLDCHDLSLPPGVIDGHRDTRGVVGMVDVLAFYDGDSNRDDTHGARNGDVDSIEPDPPGSDGWVENITVQCMDCHVRHASEPTPVTGGTNLFHLKTPVMTRDGVTPLDSNANTANGGTPDDQYELTIVNTFVSDNQNGYSWCNTCHDGTQMKSGVPNCTNCHMHGSHW